MKQPKTANPNNWTKDEIEWAFNHRCQAHGHRYTAHPNCLLKEKGIIERIGFFDVEASNLKANFGVCLCWCILPLKGKVIYDAVTKEDMQSRGLDKRIIKSFCKTLLNFDRLVHHYGTKFDLPFVRTRALYHQLDKQFPKMGEMWSTDTYYMAKNKLILSSNRQNVIAETISPNHTSIKTRIDFRHWLWGLQGREQSIRYILDHCKKDVRELKENYLRLSPFVRILKRSI